MAIEISDEELDAINKAVKTRYGIDFASYEPLSFKRRVGRVINKLQLNGVYELWTQILKKPDFIFTFINELTVGLTELFRNPDLWVYLKTDVLPEFQKNNAPIAVWHAGCSTGEEVYTFGITCFEAGCKQNCQQIAVDINTKFLLQAEAGEYPLDLKPAYEKNFYGFAPKNNFNFYFLEKQGNIYAQPWLKEGMIFKEMNLVKEYPKGPFDIIFCRNVMIYFDQELKIQLIKRFAELLKPNGLLILGYFDALPPEYAQYFELHKPEYKIFKPLPKL